jgi:hypothetical protein
MRKYIASLIWHDSDVQIKSSYQKIAKPWILFWSNHENSRLKPWYNTPD